jgi:hypothetical protein
MITSVEGRIKGRIELSVDDMRKNATGNAGIAYEHASHRNSS